MGVQVKADTFLELVDESAEVEQLGTGFTFTEGPIWNPDGFLLFSDMPGDVRRRWDPDSGVSEVANPSNKGNGMTIDNDGRLLVCEHVTSSVVRMDPDGRGGGREVLATHYDGRELNSPHDVVVKSDGRYGGRIPEDWRERFIRAYDLEFQEWLDAVAAGRSTGPSSWDGYAATVACDAALEALNGGQRVPVSMRDKPDLYTAATGSGRTGTD